MKKGDAIKVFLPGESPWAIVVKVHKDGSFDGKIDNKLRTDMSEHEMAQFTKKFFGTVKPLPVLHDYHFGDIIRFCKRKCQQSPTGFEWVPEI